MRIHLVRACAASMALALGLAALPAAAQTNAARNNNVAFNRRLAVSDQERTPAPKSDGAVQPATVQTPIQPAIIAQPRAVYVPIAQPPVAQPPVTQAPVVQQPGSQPVVVNNAAPSTMLQPIPARAASTMEAAPVPAPAPIPTQPALSTPVVISQQVSQPVSNPAPRMASVPMGQAYYAPQYAQPQVAPAPVQGGMNYYAAPRATMVNERHMRYDEPQPMAQSPMPQPAAGESMMGGDCGCGDESCCGCDGGNGWFNGPRRGRGRWLGGVEFLFARPHFSEPTAFILHQDPILGPGNVLTTSDTFVYHEFDYEASGRAYLAYRLDDCCAELRATYTHLTSDSSKSATTNANGTIVPTFFEIQPTPGNTMTSNMGVEGDILDVDFSRCIRAGGECIPCDCRTCPEWDLSWSAGAKIARWDLSHDVFTNVAADGAFDMQQEFVGAGPKIGLEGKRYFGSMQQFSVYSTFDAALLVGWYENDAARRVPSVGVNPATVESFHSQVTRTIPMTEIELGMRWQPYERLTVSAGWFFQAWWDLGVSTQQTSALLGGTGPQYLLDDSNIMSWDGLTLKAELSF